MKKLLVLISFVALSCFYITAEAAPREIISSNDNGNARLVEYTSKTGDNITIYDNYYTISGYGAKGIKMYVYILDAQNNVYIIKKVNGVPIEWEIGAAEIFFKEISLNKGNNKIAVVAERLSEYDVERFGITVKDKDIINRIKELTVDIKQGLGMK